MKGIVEDKWNCCKNTRSTNVSSVVKADNEGRLNEGYNDSVTNLGAFEKSPQELESNSNQNVSVRIIWKIQIYC